MPLGGISHSPPRALNRRFGGRVFAPQPMNVNVGTANDANMHTNLTQQDFQELLGRNHETPGVEFKGPGVRSDKQLFAKVVRAVLGMANRRDGGLVIVGVEDTGNQLNPTGLSAAELDTWDYDDIAANIATYADPSVTFERQVMQQSGSSFLILAVNEFEEIPVLCRKAYEPVLRAGACYVRTRRIPETSEIPSQTEMRDLFDLAIEKGVRKYVARSQAAGLSISGAPLPNDEDRFNEQLGDLK